MSRREVYMTGKYFIETGIGCQLHVAHRPGYLVSTVNFPSGYQCPGSTNTGRIAHMCYFALQFRW